jgi:hypothetical protein
MQAYVSSRRRDRSFQTGDQNVLNSLAIPHEATQSRDRRSNVIFGVSVAIVPILLAILSVATGVAPTVDPVAFLSP